MKVEQFIIEEVIHQGFNPYTPEGELRIQWMGDAWTFAQRIAQSGVALPSLTHVLEIGRIIEPGHNMNGFRRVNVQVGQYVAPSFTAVPSLMDVWQYQLPTLDPFEAYKRFQIVHPFTDGNGRTGKVILAWLLRNFDDPEFPPDFFGNGIP